MRKCEKNMTILKFVDYILRKEWLYFEDVVNIVLHHLYTEPDDDADPFHW